MILQRARSFAFIALSFWTINCAQAVDRDWNQAAGVQVFNTGTNWTPNGTPVAGDNLAFPLNGDVDIFLGAPSVGNNITFTDGIVEFLDVGGSTLNSGGVVTIDDAFAAGLGDGAQVTLNSATWDNVGDSIVGDAGFGSFSLNTSGDFRSEDLFIGDDLGSVGVVNVDGAGTTLQTDGLNEANGFFIGNAGTGTLNVTGGGLARIVNDVTGTIANFELGFLADGEGTLNISGSGSQVIAEDVLIGRAGTGHLNITAGGVLNQNIFTSPDAFVALDAGSSGDVTVNGDGSQWLMERLEIGNLGDATLSVEAGGLVRSNNDDMVLGDTGGSGRAAVFGTGIAASLLDVNNSLYVGNAGLGVLHVGQDLDGNANGTGALQVDLDLRIGDDTTNNAANKAVVDGANATANVDNVTYAGLSGTGTLEITGGAQFTGRFLRVGQNAGSNGTLLIDGPNSLLDTDADVTDVEDNTVIGTSGTGMATISNGGRLNTDELWVGYQGAGDGTLTIDNATVNAGVDNAGTGSDLIIGGRTDVASAGGTGTVVVQNGGVLTSAVLTIIGGNATATGTLTVTGPGSYVDNSDNAPNSAPNDTLRVGQNSGTAFLNILDGGRLDTEAAWTGLGGGTNPAEVVVDGAGSTFNVDNFLRIGDGRESTFTVSNGGRLNVAASAQAGVDNNQLIVGYLAGGDGATLTVTGAGSLIDFFGNERISAGLSGGETNNRATINVLDGGRLNAVQRDGGGAVVSSGFLMVGDETGSHGQVTVDGTDSRVDVRYMQVGDGPTNSSGIVDITGGGLITTLEHVEAGSNGAGVGTINITGLGSRLEVGSYLSLGDDIPGDGPATGNLNVTDGGAVTNGGQAYIGHFTGSFGTATLGSATSDVSSWTIGGELTIAGTETSSQLSGFGVLNVNTGGLVDIASNLRIRNLGDINLSGGEIAVGDQLLFTDAGSTFNFNSGTLRFTNAAGYTLNAAQLAGVLGSIPTVGANKHLAVDGTTVLSAPLRLNGGTFSVGAITPANLANLDWDAGTLNVTAQNVVVGATGLLGDSVVIDADQSLGVPNNQVTVNAGADLNVIRGGLSVASATNNGLMVVSNTSSVDFDTDESGSGLTNNGDLVAIDSTIAGAVANNGAIEIVGAVNFTDGISLTAGGSLGIDIGGLVDFDAISVGSDASLGGTLNVEVDGFSLTAGDSFEIMDIAGTQGGTFTGLTDGALVGNFGGVDLFIDYDGGDGNDVVLFTEGTAGDFDSDGDVDGRDFLVWQRGGSPNPLSSGDLDEWQANYGSGSLASSRAVPEPGCLGLLVALMIAFAVKPRDCIPWVW